MVLWVIFGSLMASNSGRDRAQRSWILEREVTDREGEREINAEGDEDGGGSLCDLPSFLLFLFAKNLCEFPELPPVFHWFSLSLFACSSFFLPFSFC